MKPLPVATLPTGGNMAAQTVAELTIDEFRALIRETVTEVVAELLDDPDGGLELSDWAVARLE